MRRPSRLRSPLRRVAGALSPVAYTLSLPTVGRRRVSPVTTQDRFLQAATRSTPVVRHRPSASTGGGRISGVLDASSKGGDWRTTQAEVPSPGVSLPGPFVTVPSPDAPVVPPWLRTPAMSCGVRAESSERVRSRPGRLRRRSTSFHHLTVSSRSTLRGRLNPEPLRLTRPFRA